MPMTLKRAAAALLCALAPAIAIAQSYPARPITLIVPFPPGGTTDVLARSLGQDLGKALGQPVVIESKPGAGATLGADYVAKSKPDGYILLLGAVHHVVAANVYKKLPYDFSRDLAPITTIALVPNVVTVNAKSPANSLGELLAAAKAAPGKYSFGSNGLGTAQHLLLAQMEQSAGIKLLHVPYKGSGPLTTDLLGGQVDLSCDTITPVLPHIKAGKLRGLAVVNDKRAPQLPEVPTVDEAGLKGITVRSWFSVAGPAGMPRDVITRLNAEMVKVINSAEFRQRMADIGAQGVGDSPEQLAARIKEDTERFAQLVKAAGITIE